MAIKSYFFNAVESGGVYDRIYSAEDFTSFLGSLITDGVKADPSTSLQVLAASGLTIKVKAGECWIKGHKMTVDADYSITLSSASSSLPRIDSIVARLDMTNRTMTLDKLTGTTASSPTAPTLTRTSSAWELRLANISVAKSATSILQQNITDTRSSDECGWVAGIITQVDTETLFLQYQAAYNAAINYLESQNSMFTRTMSMYLYNMQAGWDTWFRTLTDQLTIATYFQKFEKTEVTSWGSEDPHEVTLDMTGYAYDSADIIFVYINGLKAIEGIDYSLFISSQVKVRINTLGSTSDNDQTINIVVLKSKIGFENLITDDEDPIVTEDDDNLVV